MRWRKGGGREERGCSRHACAHGVVILWWSSGGGRRCGRHPAEGHFKTSRELAQRSRMHVPFPAAAMHAPLATESNTALTTRLLSCPLHSCVSCFRLRHSAPPASTGASSDLSRSEGRALGRAFVSEAGLAVGIRRCARVPIDDRRLDGARDRRQTICVSLRGRHVLHPRGGRSRTYRGRRWSPTSRRSPRVVVRD